MEREYVAGKSNGEREGEKHRSTPWVQIKCDSWLVWTCVSVCMYFGHWLWLPRLPALLEMPAAVMCCDRGWFLWLTALAGGLLCHANEQMRRWAGLTADRRATHMTSLTHPHLQITSYQVSAARGDNILTKWGDKKNNKMKIKTRVCAQIHDHTNTAGLASLCSFIASPCIREIPRYVVHNKQHAVG